MRRLLVLLSGALLGSCTAMHEGPPIDLAEIAVPKIVSDAAIAPKPVLAPLTPPAVQTRGGFKVWIPRVVTPNGDVHAGHYVEVSDKAPQKELIKPDYEIPKAPKQIYRPPAKRETPSGQGPSGTPSPRVSQPLPPSQGSLPSVPPLPQEGAYEPSQP